MLRPPRELRDTFDLLSNLDQELPLDRLLARIDWLGVTPQQVCHAVLGRMPQDLHYGGLTEASFEPAAYFRALLLSSEFQDGLVANLLGAYPEKPRRFFVHIPRCGGTSLGETLSLHACTVPYNAIGTDWCGGRGFLDMVAGICRMVPQHEAIHVTGHYTLRSLLDGRLARFGDSVWTSVRPPHQIVLSYLNYILTILAADPELVRPDTRHWARLLGMGSGRLDHDPASTRRTMLMRMIRHRTLIPRDLLCHFLGDGTAASALDLLAAADVEVIDSRRLDRWREQRWNVPARPWANVSRPFFQWSELDEEARRGIGRLVRQDTVLHRIIAPRLGQAVSVGGLQIASGATTVASPASAEPRGRIRRASRPLLVDPGFRRVAAASAAGPAAGSRVGWTDPPLHYRTIETTLRLPLIDTRIRVRYARRPPASSGLRLPEGLPWRRAMHRLFGRLGAMLVR